MEFWEEQWSGASVLLRNRPGERRTMRIVGMSELRDRTRELASEVEPPVLVLEIEVVHAELDEVVEMVDGRPIKDFLPWVEAMAGIEEYPLPVLAAIPRQATAGGFELSLACDVRVAAPQARLGLYETRMGIIPGAGGTQRLPRRIGLGPASLLVYGGRSIDGREAHRLGLAEVLADDPVARALELAGEFAANGATVLAAAKCALRASAQQPLAEGLRTEGLALLSVIGSEFARERLDSWRRGKQSL